MRSGRWAVGSGVKVMLPDDPNPYASPTVEDDTDRPSGPFFPRPYLLWLPVIWALFLFLALPVVQRIPLELRIATSSMSLLAIILLSRSANRMGHLICLPLHALLLFMQSFVWVFPWHGHR